jgi:hypothetical protein
MKISVHHSNKGYDFLTLYFDIPLPMSLLQERDGKIYCPPLGVIDPHCLRFDDTAAFPSWRMLSPLLSREMVVTFRSDHWGKELGLFSASKASLSGGLLIVDKKVGHQEVKDDDTAIRKARDLLNRSVEKGYVLEVYEGKLVVLKRVIITEEL